MRIEKDPFDIVERIQEEIEKGITKAFKGMPDFGYRTPRADLSETEDELIIRIDAPGFEKSDFAIKATETDLEISAERKEEREKEEENYYRRERHYGKFYRSFTLPTKVIPEESNAKYKNGVLEIRLKKVHPEKRKRRDIQVE